MIKLLLIAALLFVPFASDAAAVVKKKAKAYTEQRHCLMQWMQGRYCARYVK